MTRDFNKQPRNDSRPPFRNSSSKHNNRDERTERAERTPRTSRPRLNREVVDRAWESGAPQHHADYRPRETNRQGGQYSRSPRNTQGGRYEQYGPRNSQRGQYGNAPRSSHDYNNSNTSRVNNYSDSNYGPRRDRDDRGFQDRRPGNGQYQGSRDTYSPRNTHDTRGNQRDGYRDNHYNSSSRFPQQDRHSGSRNSYGNEGQRFNRRDDYRENDGHTRSNGHFEQRGYSQRPYQGRNQGRDERFHEGRGNDRYNQYDQRPPRQRSFEGPQAQFEGDYESFNEQRGSHERPSRPRSEERPFRGSPNNRGQSGTRHQRDERPRERHVTPLPDGRVIKGSRPAQRRNARFWTDVSEETDELLNHVSPVTQNDAEPATASQELSETLEGTDTPENTAGVLSNESETGSDEHSAEGAENAHTSSDADNNAEFAATREAIRRRTRAASAVVREKKEKHSKSTGPRPSQPGFKWPTE